MLVNPEQSYGLAAKNGKAFFVDYHCIAMQDFDGGDIEYDDGEIEYDDVYQEISDYADGEGGCASIVIMIIIGTAGLIYTLSATV